MTDATERRRGDDDPLVMVGRVLAGQTHELTNVLAIVQELSGLLEDYAAPQQGSRIGERLSSVAERLRRQAERGQRMVADLNALAHAVDHDHLAIDLGDLLPLAERLVARYARLKRIDIAWTPAVGIPSIAADPYRTLHAIVAAGEGAIARARPDTPVTVCARIDDGRLVVEARIPSPDDTISAHRSQVAPPALGCSLEWRPDTAPPTLLLTLDPFSGGAP
jgi:hypothetical protein